MNQAAALNASTTRYVLKKTRVSVFVSMAFSAVFFLLVFRDSGSVEIWAPDYLAFDFLPQSAAASLMAALVPALQTRAAMLRGELPGIAPTTSFEVRRAFLFMLLGLALAGIVISILKVSSVVAFPWGTAFAIKVAYGGLLGAIVTPLAMRALLKSDQR
jgi:membrane-associated PAP2 superfamily phosphatase